MREIELSFSLKHLVIPYIVLFFFLGQSDPAPLQHDMEQYKARMESFGFHAIVVDGHDVEELLKAFAEVSFITIYFFQK